MQRRDISISPKNPYNLYLLLCKGGKFKFHPKIRTISAFSYAKARNSISPKNPYDFVAAFIDNTRDKIQHIVGLRQAATPIKDLKKLKIVYIYN